MSFNSEVGGSEVSFSGSRKKPGARAYISAGPEEGTATPQPGGVCNLFTHQFATDPAKRGADPSWKAFARSALTLLLLDCGVAGVPEEGRSREGGKGLSSPYRVL